MRVGKYILYFPTFFLLFGLLPSHASETDKNVMDAQLSGQTGAFERFEIACRPKDTAEFNATRIDGRLEKRASEPSALTMEGTALSRVPDYEWWYGCSPTAAGMLLGYYDISGYGGETYRNLVPAGVAELSTFPSIEGSWTYKVQQIIASPRHVSDFYVAGYGSFGDDIFGAPTGPLDSLADFMGTSQDAYGNINGGTTWFFRTDGSRGTVSDIYNAGISDLSGSFGIYEFLSWAGYGDGNPQAVDYIYNQFVDSLDLPSGFTFSDYQAEIDAGRLVLVHVENHSMLGYGYDTSTGELLVHDTANPGEQRMFWGGSYYGMGLLAVTVVDLTGIPGDQQPPVISDDFPWELFMPAILHGKKSD